MSKTILREDKVAIIIPAFNESGAIKNTINGISKKYTRIFCIDDGSNDDTRTQIMATRAQAISHPVNLGQGASLQTGIDYALLDKTIEYFVTFDADGQHRIEDVDAMLSHIRKNPKLQIVLGSRFLGETENITWLKKCILKLAIIFSNRSSGIKLTDTHNGLRVFNRQVAEKMQLKMADYAHASEIIERIANQNFVFEEFPVKIVYTEYSRSKGQSMINAVNIAFDMVLSRIDRK